MLPRFNKKGKINIVAPHWAGGRLFGAGSQLNGKSFLDQCPLQPGTGSPAWELLLVLAAAEACKFPKQLTPI